jgi:predicted dehydrogenase
VFVGHVHLYNPAFLALLETLPTLGAIRYVYCERMNGNARADSSVLWDWLPHDLSMAHAIFGKHPTDVSAWYLSGSPKAEAAVSKFLFGDVPLLSVMSWLSPIGCRRMTISAEKGTVVFDDKAQRKLISYGLDGSISNPTYDDALPLTREMWAFLEMIRSGKANNSHVALGDAIAHMVAAAEHSIANGGASVNISTGLR